jgi:hypothetical protein
MWMAAVGLACAVVLAGCVGPAKDFRVYEAKAAHGAEQALSAVQTVRVAIGDAVRHHNFGAYLSVTMRDAEEDASAAEGYFSSIQPPDARSDSLRAQAGDLLSRAGDAVEQARIQMRRGDVEALARLERDLVRLSRDLNRFVERHG